MRGSRKLEMAPAWVEVLAPEARPVEYRDVRQRGLVLRVEPSGRKTWVARFTFEGVEQRLTVGTFPETKLKAAREAVERIRGRAQGGDNEAAAKRALRIGETVSEVAESWLASEDTRYWRPRSRRGFEALLRNYIRPKLGTLKLVRLQRAHVQKLLDGIEQLHTRNRVLEVLRMLSNWSLGRGLISVSPCAGVKKLREPKRDRTLTDEEIRQVVVAFDATTFGSYVRLLFLTAARRDELLGMRWADVERDVWRIPREMEKTGATRAEARRLPLSGAAVAALAAQRERNMARGLGGSPWVFPAASGERFHRDALKPVIYRFKGMRENGTEPRPHKLAKARPQLVPADFRLHDVRRSISDRMLNTMGLDAYVVDVGILGHAKPAMLGVYAPALPAKAKDAAEAWASELERILGEPAPTREAWA